MTQDAQGPSPEEAPSPPASTRWTRDTVEDDEALAPPFVPGRGPGTAPAEADAAPVKDAEDAAEPAGAPAADDHDPFPFETTGGTAEPDSQPEPEAPPEPEFQPEPRSGGDAFPFEQFDIEGDEAGEAPPAPAEVRDAPADEAGAASPMASGGGWTPAELDDGLDGTPSAGPAVEAEPEEVVDTSSGSEAESGAGAEPGEDAAALLERLARLLREDGVEAVRREMESPDRLTALVAGLVAGYVTGRGGANSPGSAG